MSQIFRTYFGLGSNLGDRLDNLQIAIHQLINNGVHIDEFSGLYETPPWGVLNQPSFLNSVVSGMSDLSASELLIVVKEIEKMMGRDMLAERWTERIIDIDILFIGDQTITSDELTVPHSLIEERAFVLVPLCDIAGHLVNPVTDKTSLEALTALDIQSKKEVVKIAEWPWT
ncbi:MAG: 2-amino-4-hydroxy-6-hydroxymethyldihydropteridine diphosphokinase [Chloroflexi bacterium]|nr:2-amino-4-hydroxy-6-hydroxymethyldihydropteridine diphosphokinase [Chloroflexota bacterium]|tara:strand:- start:276 stop:791 length:516 start_codon:yes stop_codon:yes gene_type:complete